MGKLSIIGVTESSGCGDLSSEAVEILGAADYVIGAMRHIAKVGTICDAESFVWTSPLSETFATIERLLEQDSSIVVLATGDPMFFGIGVSLVREFGSGVRILPNIGAFSYSTSRLGWSSAECCFMSLHGRALESLRRYLFPCARILILSYDESTPLKVAEYVESCGYGKSRMSVLCDLGSDKEELFHFDDLSKLEGVKFSNLNTIALEVNDNLASVMEFEHDGQITKDEVRAVTMMRLRAYPRAHLWDLGAGCGSISVSWALAGGTVSAIEQNSKRIKLIEKNVADWGVGHAVSIMEDAIGDKFLTELPSADAIFWGGGIDCIETLENSYNLLKRGGMFVANAVTIEGMEVLLAFQKRHGGDLSRIQTESLSFIGAKQGFSPARAVYQYWKQK